MRRSRLATSRRVRPHEEISPMESMVNLVDVMLVFICGLLISIITYWNIDVGKLVTITNQQNMVKIDDPDQISEQLGVTRSFDNVGTALLDPVTGDVYILQDEVPAE